MKVDVFFRLMLSKSAAAKAKAAGRKVWEAADTRYVSFEVSIAADPVGIVREALQRGASSGSGWSGIYEIQTDKGIWSRADGRKLFRSPQAPTLREIEAVQFTPWDHMEDEAHA